MSRIVWSSAPPSWTVQKLENVADIIMGQSPPSYSYNNEGIGFPFYQGKSDFGDMSPTPVSWCTEPARIAEAGDILISVRAPVGPTNIALVKSCIGRGLAAIRPDLQYIKRDFLLYYLRSIEPIIVSKGSGSTFEAINKKDLCGLRIVIPPLPEQHRIVEILKQADEILRQRREVIEEAKKLPITLFVEMFGDPIVNSKGFKIRRLTQLGELSRGMSKHRPRDAAFLYGGQYPFIQTGDVANSDGWISSYSQTYSEAGLAQSRLWPANTLCITIAANIAKTGILEFDSCFPDSVVGFLPGNEVTTEYSMFAINHWQKTLEAQAPQGAQKNINLKILSNLPITVPPLDRQIEFSSIVNEVRRTLRKLENLKQDSEILREQICFKAFKGDLTENWRKIHHQELEAWLSENTNILYKRSITVTSTESALQERPLPARPARRWLMDQLSKVQTQVYKALQEWKGTFIPSEDINRFLEEWPVEHLEDMHDHVLRALNQLTGMGFIYRIGIPNQVGEYVTAYRLIREEELTKDSDIKRLGVSN